MLRADGGPHCDNCGGMVRPDVVLFGEGLDNDLLGVSIKAISSADTLIIGGTSLVVQPAAGLVRYFRGQKLVMINKSATAADEWADLVLHEPIGRTMESVMAIMEETGY